MVIAEPKVIFFMADDHTRLKELARLIPIKNKVDGEIAALVGRPTQLGHVGEFIAAEIFGIMLNFSAAAKSDDGYFKVGHLKGKTVNVKWYPKREGVLDINPRHVADYYLVLTGPKSSAVSSKGCSRPWLIESVFLFDMHKLVDEIRSRGTEIGKATSILEQSWKDAEIYPHDSPRYTLSKEQKHLLSLFRGR